MNFTKHNPWFRNTDFIKTNADAYFSKLGYTVLGIEGMDADLIYGGMVWYQVVRTRKRTQVYTVLVRRQGDSIKWCYDRLINSPGVVE